MGRWGEAVIRGRFESFFRGRGYDFLPSSSVLPSTKAEQHELVFVNAGMHQFKPRLLGIPDAPHRSVKKAMNWQRCIRTGGKHNDLALVGRDGTHLTFFEMLGHWGFDGSVGKKEGCGEAWTLLTQEFQLPPHRFIATYFAGDDSLGLPPDTESRDAWLSLGLPVERVLPRPMEDNFWQMGPSGPCGPCTELHYVAPNKGEVKLESAVELWNLVFMEYERWEGTLRRLPGTHMDTGLGLERLATVLQDVSTVYETSSFAPLLTSASSLLGCRAYGGEFGEGGERDTNLRILVDHSRMATVAISDQVPIRKKGPYFILRRCIRRAAFAALQLRPQPDYSSPVLPELASKVIEILGDAYPILLERRDSTLDIIRKEEAGFLHQLGTQIEGYLKARRREPKLCPRTHFAKVNQAMPSQEILTYMQSL